MNVDGMLMKGSLLGNKKQWLVALISMALFSSQVQNYRHTIEHTYKSRNSGFHTRFGLDSICLVQ